MYRKISRISFNHMQLNPWTKSYIVAALLFVQLAIFVVIPSPNTAVAQTDVPALNDHMRIINIFIDHSCEVCSDLNLNSFVEELRILPGSDQVKVRQLRFDKNTTNDIWKDILNQAQALTVTGLRYNIWAIIIGNFSGSGERSQSSQDTVIASLIKGTSASKRSVIRQDMGNFSSLAGHLWILEVSPEVPDSLLDKPESEFAWLYVQMPDHNYCGSCSLNLAFRGIIRSLNGTRPFKDPMESIQVFKNRNDQETVLLNQEVAERLKAWLQLDIIRCGQFDTPTVKLDKPNSIIMPATKIDVSLFDKKLYFKEQVEAELLLQSDQTGNIQKYLNECLFCPHRSELNDLYLKQVNSGTREGIEEDQWKKLQENTNIDTLRSFLKVVASPTIREKVEIQISVLEKENHEQADRLLWDEYMKELSLDKLDNYIQNCKNCTFMEKAKKSRAMLLRKIEEKKFWNHSLESDDIKLYENYLKICVVCEHLEKAKAIIHYKKEQKLEAEENQIWNSVASSNNKEVINHYLSSCQLCRHQAEAKQLLQSIENDEQEFQVLVDSCRFAAAPVQYGGPSLHDVDFELAERLCKEVLEKAPDHPQAAAYYARALMIAGRFDEAKTFFDIGVSQNEASAQSGLAQYLTEHAGKKPPEDKIYHLALAAHEQNDHQGTLLLSKLLFYGHGVEKAPQRAKDVLAPLIEENHPDASLLLALMLEEGEKSPEQAKRLRELYEIAARSDNFEAKAYLAEMLEKGKGGAPDTNRAVLLYLETIARGNLWALEQFTIKGIQRDREVLRQIQEILFRINLYDGAIDGLVGPSMKSALKNLMDKSPDVLEQISQANKKVKNNGPKEQTAPEEKENSSP